MNGASGRLQFHPRTTTLIAGLSVFVLCTNPPSTSGKDTEPASQAIPAEEKVVLKVDGIKYDKGNFTRYEIPLQHVKIVLWETDAGNHIGMEVNRPGYERFEIGYDSKGRPVEHTVQMGNDCCYLDLDGDGRIDAMFDGPAHRSLILVRDSWLDVLNTKNGIQKQEKTAGGRTFALINGVWEESKHYQ
jgi:hypothetical protein